jgi:hypothetical protein
MINQLNHIISKEIVNYHNNKKSHTQDITRCLQTYRRIADIMGSPFSSVR